MGLLVRLRGWCAGLALMVVGGSALAGGTELNDADVLRLQQGLPVVREQAIEASGRRYVGGVAYIVVDAAPERVLGALEDVNAYRALLPATRNVRCLGFSREGETVIELEQGNALVHGRYVVRTRREQHGPNGPASIVRFWLDARFPHDVADARGYFLAEPLGEKTLLTYSAWVDLGPGVFSRLWEGKIRSLALSTPVRVKHYVEALPPLG